MLEPVLIEDSAFTIAVIERITAHVNHCQKGKSIIGCGTDVEDLKECLWKPDVAGAGVDHYASLGEFVPSIQAIPLRNGQSDYDSAKRIIVDYIYRQLLLGLTLSSHLLPIAQLLVVVLLSLGDIELLELLSHDHLFLLWLLLHPAIAFFLPLAFDVLLESFAGFSLEVVHLFDVVLELLEVVQMVS